MNTNDQQPTKAYRRGILERLRKLQNDESHSRLNLQLLERMNFGSYAYNWTWLGRPIIQIPQDTVTFQELIWEVRPDLIVETGVAHGGSIVFSASMLALLDVFKMVDSPLVVGIDIEIREHNRIAIEGHPAFKWVKLIEGSSVDPVVIRQVFDLAKGKSKVLIFLDSNHTHEHVLLELRSYAPLVSVGSYCVVLDTGIEDIDPNAIANGRSWGKGNSPRSALDAYLRETNSFEYDGFWHDKAWVTSAPGGFIRRIR